MLGLGWDLSGGTLPKRGNEVSRTRVWGGGGPYLTSRRIFGRKCAVETTGGLGAWTQSRPHPVPTEEGSPWAATPGPAVAHVSGREGWPHPARGDHGVLEHAAAQLAAQLHRRLLSKHQGLLPLLGLQGTLDSEAKSG